MDAEGHLSYSEVLLFLDRNQTEERQFVVLGTEEGKKITLTPSHLIFALSSESLEEDIDFENSITDDYHTPELRNMTLPYIRTRLTATFAHRIQIGDWILVATHNDTVQMQRVTQVGVTLRQGVYAPLTSAGTVVVADVIASCYAVIDDQSIAHWAFAPVRLFGNIATGAKHLWRSLSRSLQWWSAAEERLPASSPPKLTSRSERNSVQLNGIHWYAKALYRIARVVLPNHLVYN